MFFIKFDTIVTNGVETIGGKYIHPKGIGKIFWSCMDYEGKMQTNYLKIYSTLMTHW